MTMSRRVVFDTNVLISALLFEDSIPARAFFGVLRKGTVLVSLDTLQELQSVLKRKKFDKYVTVEERDVFVTLLTTTTTLVEIDERIQASQDRKDDKFLEVAVNGVASYIVTGDPDLLVLHPFRSIAIVTPAAFLSDDVTSE
jgi:uncharacterized protein